MGGDALGQILKVFYQFRLNCRKKVQLVVKFKNLYLFSVCKNQQRMLIIEIIATSTVRWFKHFCCNLLIIIFNRPFVS